MNVFYENENVFPSNYNNLNWEFTKNMKTVCSFSLIK
jgi:hypothetical protein